jgi:hypothetical protein
MNPMATFDPDRPARVHDRQNDHTFDWHTDWAANYRRYARADKVDGSVSWDGLELDGWRPLGQPS